MAKDGRVRKTEKVAPDKDDNLRQSEDDTRKRVRPRARICKPFLRSPGIDSQPGGINSWAP
jgi:hypothetical protein